MTAWNFGLNREESRKLSEEIAAERRKLPNKICASCKLKKPKSEFNKCAATLDGYHNWCRKCNKENKRKWHVEHKDEENAKAAEWYQEHIIEKYDYNVRYRIENNERLTEQRKKHYNEHRDEILAKHRTEEAKTANRERAKERWWNNPEKYREIARRQQEFRNHYIQSNPISYDYIYERDQGICYLCYEHSDRGITHFDHVIPFSRGGRHTYENVRVTHASCNCRKGNKLIAPGAYAIAPNPSFEQRFLQLCEERSRLAPKK